MAAGTYRPSAAPPSVDEPPNSHLSVSPSAHALSAARHLTENDGIRAGHKDRGERYCKETSDKSSRVPGGEGEGGGGGNHMKQPIFGDNNMEVLLGGTCICEIGITSK